MIGAVVLLGLLRQEPSFWANELTGFLVDNLATEKQASIADRDGPVLALPRERLGLSCGRDQVFHPGAVLAAEAALPSVTWPNCNEIGSVGRLALMTGHDSPCFFNTGIADEDAGTGDKLRAPSLVGAAEGTDKHLGLQGVPSSPPPTSAASVDNLLNTLVAQVQRGGDLSHGRA